MLAEEDAEQTEPRRAAIISLWTHVLGSTDFDEKVLIEFFVRPEWWYYDPFECAGMLGLDVPDVCEGWRLIHFVIARGHLQSSVSDVDQMRLAAMVKAEECLVRIAFCGRHCWKEEWCSSVNVLMHPHKLPL